MIQQSMSLTLIRASQNKEKGDIAYFLYRDDRDKFAHFFGGIVDGHYVLTKSFFNDETRKVISKDVVGVRHSYKEAEEKLYELAKKLAVSFAENEKRTFKDLTEKI